MGSCCKSVETCHLCTNTLCGLQAPVAKVLKYAVHKIEYRFIIIFNVMYTLYIYIKLSTDL